eukprot:NODE_712_length_654_cov_357.521822_g703_i0.p1 GENE.NODE_712_length_654_cov_357.521822_g703_i0~~NODE_712_length_654_cov_357.521822_g703_i0.p1  ORF type:complete len:166 (+),score=25.51 NODE_712_length_654_cov_357.521822_g703_i0:73-570(+)
MGGSNAKCNIRSSDHQWGRKDYIFKNQVPKKLKNIVDAEAYSKLIEEMNTLVKGKRETYPGWTHPQQRERWREELVVALNETFFNTGKVQSICPTGWVVGPFHSGWYYVSHGQSGGHNVHYVQCKVEQGNGAVVPTAQPYEEGVGETINVGDDSDEETSQDAVGN